MESLSTSIPNKGFTLVEVLIVMGILAAILSLGLFISFDFYKSYSFRAEKSIVVSILQKARGRSLNNIHQIAHGVHFMAEPNLKYILFEGTVYDQNNPSNVVVNASYGVSVTAPSLPFDVIFDQLSTGSFDRTITVSDKARSYNIAVNSEGRIDWQ